MAGEFCPKTEPGTGRKCILASEHGPLACAFEKPKKPARVILELRIRHDGEGYRLGIYEEGKEPRLIGPEEKSIVIAWAKRALEEM